MYTERWEDLIVKYTRKIGFIKQMTGEKLSYLIRAKKYDDNQLDYIFRGNLRKILNVT